MMQNKAYIHSICSDVLLGVYAANSLRQLFACMFVKCSVHYHYCFAACSLVMLAVIASVFLHISSIWYDCAGIIFSMTLTYGRCSDRVIGFALGQLCFAKNQANYETGMTPQYFHTTLHSP